MLKVVCWPPMYTREEGGEREEGNEVAREKGQKREEKILSSLCLGPRSLNNQLV